MEIIIKELQSQPVLYIRIRTSVDALPQVIGESYARIANYMQSLAEQPAGAPYNAYYNLDMQDMDVEMGFPVSKPLPAREPVKAGEIPAGKAASTMYKGTLCRDGGHLRRVIQADCRKWSSTERCLL